jgi:hypothetical protein
VSTLRINGNGRQEALWTRRMRDEHPSISRARDACPEDGVNTS